jgi:hypothetical protein
MLDISKTRMDDADAAGTWVDIAFSRGRYVYWLAGEEPLAEADDPRARLLVARDGNPAARKVHRKALRPYRGMMRQRGELTDEAAEKVDLETLGHAILLGWEAIMDGGKAVEYSHEQAVTTLKNNPELKFLVAQISRDFRVFREQEIAADGEALGNSSAGSSSGAPSSPSSRPPESTSPASPSGESSKDSSESLRPITAG